MRILTLNCQRSMQPGLKAYLHGILGSKRYDFIILQEVDKKVRGHLKRRNGYGLIESPHLEGTEFCILHKAAYRHLSTEFISFQPFLKVQGQVGALIATFRRGRDQYVICDAHFHWGRYFRQRRRSLSAIKELLLRREGIKVIAGDFNTVIPYENRVVKRLLSPQFHHAHYGVHSHDSAYLDPKYLFDLFPRLGRMGIRYRSQIDHIFVAGAGIASAAIHEVHVSDHRPLEAEIRRM